MSRKEGKIPRKKGNDTKKGRTPRKEGRKEGYIKEGYRGRIEEYQGRKER